MTLHRNILRILFLFSIHLLLPHLAQTSRQTVPEGQRALEDILNERPDPVFGSRSMEFSDDWMREKSTQTEEDKSEPDDLDFLRRVVDLLDLEGTVLGDMLKPGSDPDPARSLAGSLSISQLAQMISQDDDALYAFTHLYDKTETPQPQDTNDEDEDQKYIDCVKDYASYVEPLTNRLQNLIRSAICSNVSAAICNFLPRAPDLEMPPGGRRMTDVLGKLPEGLLAGPKTHFVGGYDMCEDTTIVYNRTVNNSIVDYELRTFTGKYCRLSIRGGNGTALLPLLYGVCVPEHCSKEDVARYITTENLFLRFLFRAINVTLSKTYCGQELEFSTDTSAQVAIAVIAVLFILGVIGTTYDASIRIPVLRRRYKRLGDDFTHGQKNRLCGGELGLFHRVDLVLVSFSAYSNIRKIFAAEPPTPSQQEADLPALNGIRYLSFVWVILGNTYLFGPIYTESALCANTVTSAVTLVREWYFQPVINFHLNSDSFLFISGMLMTWNFIRRYESNGQRLTIGHVIYHVVHRYWRLIPAFMFTIMFYASLYRYFIEGPLYPSDIGDADNCRINWWVDLLMVHNIVRKEHICLTWMFQLPLLFQLHVYSLIILVPLVLWPMIGHAMLFASWVAHIGVTAWISDKHRSSGSVGKLFGDYLITPWCRAGPFFIGMAFALIIRKMRYQAGKGRVLKINIIANLAGWLVSLGIMAAVTFSSYDELRDIPQAYHGWSYGAHVAYDTLARSAWGVAIGWIVIACSTKNGGVIGKFLKWNLFRPLSRLVYTALLFHPLLIFKYVYSDRVLLYVDMYHMSYLFLGHLIITIVLGLSLGLLWHYTVSIGLENAVTCKTIDKWLRSGRYPPELAPIAEERGDTGSISHDDKQK